MGNSMMKKSLSLRHHVPFGVMGEPVGPVVNAELQNSLPLETCNILLWITRTRSV